MVKPKARSALAAQLGKRIRALREAQGLTSEKLAYENDLAKGYVSEIEHGRASPSLAKLEALASGLGVEVYDLFVNPADGERAKVVEATRNLGSGSLREILRFLRSQERC